jgi:hypothetical protein
MPALAEPLAHGLERLAKLAAEIGGKTGAEIAGAHAAHLAEDLHAGTAGNLPAGLQADTPAATALFAFFLGRMVAHLAAEVAAEQGAEPGAELVAEAAASVMAFIDVFPEILRAFFAFCADVDGIPPHRKAGRRVALSTACPTPVFYILHGITSLGSRTIEYEIPQGSVMVDINAACTYTSNMLISFG